MLYIIAIDKNEIRASANTTRKHFGFLQEQIAGHHAYVQSPVELIPRPRRDVPTDFSLLNGDIGMADNGDVGYSLKHRLFYMRV